MTLDDTKTRIVFAAIKGLWLHVLTSMVMYAKYVVEGVLPDTEEAEETIFQLLTTGLSGYLTPGH